MVKSSRKGSGFERETCTKLSLWWSDNARDDIFWRSSSSGGRATTRAKKKKTTQGHYGDICAVDPIGQPLLDLAVIEVKRGYKDATIGCLIDRPRGINQQTFEGWLQQCIQTMDNAESFAWLLIVKRDRRETMIYMPDYLCCHLLEHARSDPYWLPQVTFHGKVKIGKYFHTVNIVGTHFDVWLRRITPRHILKAVEEL